MAGPSEFPRRFGSYVLLGPLARGGMGELYLAAAGSQGMQKLCVIKQVLPHLLGPENAQRFRDEAMVVVRLSHGNLVTVFDAGQVGEHAYLAMDFVEGKDLLAMWNRCAERRVAFPVDISVYIIKELARGLAYAHAFGGLNLVHRDVSPANVLLTYSGEVKLADFGLAVSTLKMQHTAPGIIYGKLSYLSPEQARQEPLDGRSDLYALGILLWELLTGQQLFPVRSPSEGFDEDSGSRSTLEVLEKLRNPETPPPSSLTSRVPRELDAIVMRALAPEPADRYQTGEELRADLAAFLAATSPATDADRLGRLLQSLFDTDIETERRERDTLLATAAAMMAGPGTTPEPDTQTPRPRLVTPPTPGAAAGEVPARTATPGPAAVAPVPARSGPKDARIGTIIGERYHIQHLCGEGAMGRVYEAVHIEIGRRVAIKILHPHYHHTPTAVERFRLEARAASRIGHPNIVDVTDSGTTPDGSFYFVMEFIDGVSLEQLIARERSIPLDRAVRIAIQVCRALQAAHAAEIIHRDLKPANVMLVSRRDEEDFVKVLDFGISRSAAEGTDRVNRARLTGPDIALGTPVYMAPEQAAGRAGDARTDIYAVGGLLYEMISGRPPYLGDDVMAVLSRKATHDPEPIRTVCPGIPSDLANVVTKSLARVPAERYATMADLKDDLVRCLEALESAPPIQRLAPEPTMRIATRRRAWIVGGVGGTTLLAGVVALSLWTERRPGLVPSASGGTPWHSPPPPAAARPPAPKGVRPAADSPWPEQPPPAFAVPNPAPALAPKRAGAPGTSPSTAVPRDRAATDSARASEMLSAGQTAFDDGQYEEALRHARRAVGAGAGVGARLLLGDAYFKLERYRDAVREYEAALRLEPGNALARRGRDLASDRALTAPE